MALTPKQQVFVDEYLKDLNATQAAVRAGYSEKTAKVIGSENLTKPDIAGAIQKAMDERSERTAITQDYVLQGIQDVTEATRNEQPAVALKGYELLGKHLKLFTEKLELGADASLAEAISAARQRRDS
jgi:phage terminase small subunit